jgi:hypothetical protein
LVKAITNPKFIESIETLDQIYDYLSSEFVHFATGSLADKQPNPKEFGKVKKSQSKFMGTRRCIILPFDIKSFD